MDSHDIIVIGAGIAGASVAYELCADRKVLVLEREARPGYHATGRSAATYIPAYGYEFPALAGLTRASRAFFDAPPAEFPTRAILRPRGVLFIGEQEQAGDLRARFEHMSGKGVELRWIDTAAALREHVPQIAENFAQCAFLAVDAHDLDVHALHDGYLRAMKRAGARLECDAEIRAITRMAGRWRVDTAGAAHSAPLLVNAAGAWVDEIAGLAGVAPIGIEPRRRTAVLLDPPAGSAVDAWPMIADFRMRFYFKPDAGLILASPGDETLAPPGDARPEEMDVAYAAHYAEQVLGLQVQRIRQSWAGLRSFVADRSPVIGFAPSHAGFFWMAGQGGHGIQIAPAAAKLAAALIRREPIPAELQRLGFDTAWVAPGRLTPKAASRVD